MDVSHSEDLAYVKMVDVELFNGFTPHLVIVVLGHSMSGDNSPQLLLAVDEAHPEDGIYTFYFAQQAKPRSTLGSLVPKSCISTTPELYSGQEVQGTYVSSDYHLSQQHDPSLNISHRSNGQMLPITASYTWVCYPENLRGVRIIANGNRIEKHLPPEMIADISH